MTLKSYLFLMFSATAICWGAFVFVLFTIDPFATNWLGFILFYFSLFLALTGSFAVLGFLLRFAALKQSLAFRLVSDAFRQSFLLALMTVSSLVLQSLGFLSWTNLFLLIGGVAALEYFLIVRGRPHPVRSEQQ
jgi:hypothetical protein